MPQISPISWIVVILVFFIIVLSIMSSLPSPTAKSTSPILVKKMNKKMKW